MSDVHDVAARGVFLALIAVVALTLFGTNGGITRQHAVGATLITVLLLLALLPFGWAFTTFHNLLFPQGNWQFSADSWLITHFPPRFFAIAAVAMVGGAAVLLANLSYLLSGKR